MGSLHQTSAVWCPAPRAPPRARRQADVAHGIDPSRTRNRAICRFEGPPRSLESPHGDAARRSLQVPVRRPRGVRRRAARGDPRAVAAHRPRLGAQPARRRRGGGGSQPPWRRRPVRRRTARRGVAGRAPRVRGGAHGVPVRQRPGHARTHARVRRPATGHAASPGTDCRRGRAAGAAGGGLRRRRALVGGGRPGAAAAVAGGGGRAIGAVPAAGVRAS